MGNFYQFSVFICILLFITNNGVVAPPPNRQAAEAQQQHPDPSGAEGSAPQDQKPMYQFAYTRYLETVVKILENDPKFTERLKGMKEEDIKAGNIADHIEDLHESVFDELTKAKLAEIERLREEIGKQIEKDGGAHNIKVPEHIDVQNWEKFNKEDLRKLVVKTVADMEELDKERREEFKKYEMQKKAEEDHKLAQMTPEEREKAKVEIEASEKRHNEHEKLKHPGGREQLEEVWEESDHMDKENFDPRTFFALHDLNGDGFWNDDEIEALFQIEIEKVYNETNPDDDPKERIEEMYRMREHVVSQMDKNNDRLISLDEFLKDNEAQTPPANKQDEGWKDIAQQDIYTDEELKKFEQDYASKQGNQVHNQQPPINSQYDSAPPLQQQQQQPPPQAVPVQPQVPVQQQQVPPVAEKKPIDPGYGI
uniref:Nucleobindin n=1 Tax=Panagrolaimus superbus TaxID=310955 RepID=A0A914Z359_9BILA